WRRRDLKRFYGLAPSGTGKTLIGWFNGRAGLELDAATGETVRRLVGLGGFYSSPHTDWALLCRRSFELHRSEELVYRLPRQSFAELSAAFAPDQCVISESGAATRSVSLTSGAEVWRYDPRAGCHVIALDYCQEIDRIVAVEYAYTEEARAVSSVVTLLHLTRRGEIALRKPIRPWAEAVVFCAQGTRLLNGLGELYDARTGEIEYVFEFPR
ncbi:MAG: hypothetical protein ACM3XS_04030, partial [Bacteroidota bacterium]